MEPTKEFKELFEEMKEVERSEEAKRNTWLALKDRMETKKKRRIFPAFISLAIIAIAAFLIFTYSLPSKTEKTAYSLSNEEVIVAFLEKEYNGPDKEILRLYEDWMNLQSATTTKTQEEYDQLLESKEYKDLMNYYQTTFGQYFTENMLDKAIRSNMVFKYNRYLENTDIKMHLETVELKQQKDHPNIYRPVIEVSLTNSQGQKISHTLKEEFIFSKSEPGKIGSYNVARDGGSIEFQEKIENFSAYVENGSDVRKASIDVSFDTLCFNGVVYGEEERNVHGCTSDRNLIQPIMLMIDDPFIKEVTEQESSERAEALLQMDNYQIYFTNAADKGTTLYTITLYEDGVFLFAPGLDIGINGDISTEPNTILYEEIKRRLGEFAES